ncbi:uncharacterized protein LOC123670624 isoform X1 [Harmonia axyridis]|uniref:uncharacterized protein LOC123670624 isoform X1 n=1 Tax=Harmonia axyridis TaxID=115357 RepID=UPI001E2767F2|nr:uncharacterized protein LOC123670624 isoform X1 [Harmonia axyridis]
MLIGKFKSEIKILYNNINSYMPKKYLVNNFIETNDIKSTMFVEAQIKEEHSTGYRDWDTIHRIGHKINNTRGGSLVQCHPSLKMGKNNCPVINNNLNEALHFTTPFKEENLHIFLVYIHPRAKIEETIFTKAALYKYSIIVGDFNPNEAKNKQIKKFLQNDAFKKFTTPPTFLENNPDSTRDLLFYPTNLRKNIKNVDLAADLGSDHLSMVITLDMQSQPDNIKGKKSLQFDKCKLDRVNQDMKQFIDLHKNSRIDENYISLFNEELSDCIVRYTFLKTHHPFLHELPPYIIKMIKNKRKMYRAYQRRQDPALKPQINECNKSIHQMIQQYK